VRTAVDDFVERHPELEYRQVEAVFGVGYVYPADAPWAPRLREVLDPWHGNRLVERLERNRVRLYARVLELQDLVQRVGLRASRSALELEDRIEALEAENAALRLERARARAAAAGTPG
jgi:hypothetical protein